MNIPPASPKRPAMQSRLLFVLASAFGGFLFGLGISRIPSPSGPGVFWVSNLASPWLVTAFLAGRLHKTRRWAALAGVACEIACVVGFYSQFLVIDHQKWPRGRDSAVITRIADNLDGWLVFIAPWIGVAIAAGLIFGMIGWWRGYNKSVLAGALVGLPFLIEPWVWRNMLGYNKGSWVPWIGEMTVGAAVLLWVAIIWRRGGETRRN